MAATQQSPLTAEDLYRLADDGRMYELVKGRLVSEPLPGGRHGRVAANVVFMLQSWALKTGAGVVYTCDTGFVLERNPDTVRGPDVAFLSTHRYRRIDDDIRFVDGAPDLAVEVLWPGNRAADIKQKVADNLAAGASAVWVVDPQDQTVAVHTCEGTTVFSSDDRLTDPGLLPGFDVAVRELFDLPGATSQS